MNSEPPAEETSGRPPDFLLKCTRCGSEVVWDTEELSPVGTPQVGEPVLWFCGRCGREMRHAIVDLYVLIDKLHHEISLVTELDRATVDRVMEAVYRQRRLASCERLAEGGDPATEVEQAAEASGVSVEMVERIAVAEADWMLRRGYLVERSAEE